MLTTACLLAYEDYSAEGIAETAVEVAGAPRDVFDDLIGQSKPLRDFEFAAFLKRIIDLFLMIDQVAFQRLADKLIKISGGAKNVLTALQKLSVELGTAREVISRQLKEFRRREWIEQARGGISLPNRAQFQNLADHNK